MKDRGLRPASQTHAYSMLYVLADDECTERSGLKVLELLKGALFDPSERQPGKQKKTIWRLSKQLQCRTKLQRIRDSLGNTLSDPAAIAEEFTTVWAGIMNTGGGGRWGLLDLSAQNSSARRTCLDFSKHFSNLYLLIWQRKRWMCSNRPPFLRLMGSPFGSTRAIGTFSTYFF